MRSYLLYSALLLAFMCQVVTPALHNASLKSTQCCVALSEVASLNSKVVYPNTTDYQARLDSYYSANAALPPSCMVLPETTYDVSKIAEIISGHGCPFGMRSGGHSAFRGASSVSDGITIDFGYMNTTTYDADSKLASIQPGSNWGKVYKTLDPFGITVPGGRSDVVGVGGFVTGGGYSFHSGLKGWACDNVHNFEVVLANGTIANANAQENPDLFEALKGGSGNFGFVTRLDMYVIESTQIWAGIITFDLSDRHAVFDVYYNLTQNFGEHPASQTTASITYAAGNLSLFSIVTDSEGNPTSSAFDSYTTIANISDTTRLGSVAELVPPFTESAPELGVYANWFTLAVSNKFVVELSELMYTLLVEYSAKMEATITHGSALSMIAAFQPIPRAFVDHGAAKGGANVMGLEDIVSDDDPLAMWLLTVTVTEEEDQAPVLSLAEEFVDTMEKKAVELGANRGWYFMNYAHSSQNPFAGYGAGAMEKIKAASVKYDPEGVFQNLRHSGLKIPE